jgi:hypothetical protein
MRQDSVLSRPARPAARPAGWVSALAGLVRRLRALPARGYAGAALTAVLTGIVINALTLQHERHPAPFFAPRPLPALATAPAPAAPSSAARSDESPSAPVLPPERPSGLEAAPGAGRRGDAIGDILREDSDKETQKAILAAQNALIRLGYTLHADGVENAATLTALREFERTHSLPISTDITPRLLKHLAAATGASGR